MRVYLVLYFMLHINASIIAQLPDSNKVSKKFGIHIGIGMQGDIYKQIGVNGISDYSQWDYIPPGKSIASVFIDIGGVYSLKQWEVGAAARLALASKSLTGGAQEFSIVPMPAAWIARYFGKHDMRGFRVGFNLTPVIEPRYMEEAFTPSPTDRVAPILSSLTYWAFGPTIGTRIFRKGWFKDTYINLNPQVAPPNPVDKQILTEVGWYWRVNAMLTKNFNFRK